MSDDETTAAVDETATKNGVDVHEFCDLRGSVEWCSSINRCQATIASIKVKVHGNTQRLIIGVSRGATWTKDGWKVDPGIGNPMFFFSGDCQFEPIRLENGRVHVKLPDGYVTITPDG